MKTVHSWNRFWEQVFLKFSEQLLEEWLTGTKKVCQIYIWMIMSYEIFYVSMCKWSLMNSWYKKIPQHYVASKTQASKQLIGEVRQLPAGRDCHLPKLSEYNRQFLLKIFSNEITVKICQYSRQNISELSWKLCRQWRKPKGWHNIGTQHWEK